MNKAFRIFLTVFMAISLLSSIVFANNRPDIGTVPGELSGFQTFGNNILAVVQWVGYAIAIGMLIYVGVKYTMASANEKADLKAAMVKYVIGAILIAGAVTIAGWLFDVGGAAGNGG